MEPKRCAGKACELTAEFAVKSPHWILTKEDKGIGVCRQHLVDCIESVLMGDPPGVLEVRKL